jgi:hypothetical protein
MSKQAMLSLLRRTGLASSGSDSTPASMIDCPPGCEIGRMVKQYLTRFVPQSGKQRSNLWRKGNSVRLRHVQ